MPDCPKQRIPSFIAVQFLKIGVDGDCVKETPVVTADDQRQKFKGAVGEVCRAEALEALNKFKSVLWLRHWLNVVKYAFADFVNAFNF